jgi:bifunctional DNA-binding transcriptional regulator/antitoxin component of YhaV-PrlF toxin-antitoxin module
VNLDFRFAALQHCSIAIVIPISKRGTVTLPPSLRRSLGLEGLENPMLIANEVDGKLVLEPATAIPVRDIPEKTVRKWINEDEAAMKAFSAKKKK